MNTQLDLFAPRPAPPSGQLALLPETSKAIASPVRELVGLTLHRPWPWAFFAPEIPASERKNIENRTWPPPLRLVREGAWLALHAGKAWDERGDEFLRGLGLRPPSPEDHPSGVILGVARVVGVVMVEPGRPVPGRWCFGPFGWQLAGVRALATPVPCRGMQGLWPLPPEVEAEVRARLGGGAR